MAEVSVFAGMTGKNRHFRDLSQQVLSGVVGPKTLLLAYSILSYAFPRVFPYIWASHYFTCDLPTLPIHVWYSFSNVGEGFL